MANVLRAELTLLQMGDDNRDLRGLLHSMAHVRLVHGGSCTRLRDVTLRPRDYSFISKSNEAYTYSLGLGWQQKYACCRVVV